MIGEIEAFNEEKQTWIITSEQQQFEFTQDQWTENQGPFVGDQVLFEGIEGLAREITLIGNYPEPEENLKSRKVAAILGLLLGGFGAHRFYLGYTRIGIIQVVVTVVTVGFGLIWGFVEGFLIFTGQIDKDAQGNPLK